MNAPASTLVCAGCGAPAYWQRLRAYLPAWDELIADLNRRVAAG